jgi:hypothetical protein
MVTDEQIRLYRRKRAKGLTQEAAAAAAGISANTARKWEDLLLPSLSKRARDWRTRPDPLGEDWANDIVPRLKEDADGALLATTLLEVIQAKHPGKYDDGILRTIQRRVRDWRALYGPGHEVVFEQDYPPGGYAQADFTHGTQDLKVTIRGELFVHLFFELRLCFSRWRSVSLHYGETYESLSSGVQDGFWELEGVPHHLQTDNLSAATQELKDEYRGFTKRYKALMDHYGVVPKRIKAGESQQNGGVEKDHDTLKTAIDQALILRNSRDFDSIEAYWAFVKAIVARLNEKRSAALALERPYLKPLPSSRVPCYTDTQVTVRRTSCIQVRNNTYTVNSRLIGHEVIARVHPNTIDILHLGRLVETFPRLRGRGHHRIDYRHIVHSLVNKPGAFAHYRFREELFPTLTFRKAYDALLSWCGSRADIEYVRILHLAATTMEITVEEALIIALGSGRRFDYASIEQAVAPHVPSAEDTPAMEAFVPDLIQYDEILEEAA